MTIETAKKLYKMYVDTGRQALADDIEKNRPGTQAAVEADSKPVETIKSKKGK